jgi:hypothetical protein
MDNYTNPQITDEGQNPKDLLNSTLIFARALGLILEEREGIVVDLVGDMDIKTETNKVIVFKYNEQVHVYKCDEDLPEGTPVNMTTEDNKQI